MLVLQGTTPEEVKKSILEYIQKEETRYRRQAIHQRLKIDKACDIARATALANLGYALHSCTLADLRETNPKPAFSGLGPNPGEA